MTQSDSAGLPQSLEVSLPLQVKRKYHAKYHQYTRKMLYKVEDFAEFFLNTIFNATCTHIVRLYRKMVLKSASGNPADSV